jgi:hypothetical protein
VTSNLIRVGALALALMIAAAPAYAGKPSGGKPSGGKPSGGKPSGGSGKHEHGKHGHGKHGHGKSVVVPNYPGPVTDESAVDAPLQSERYLRVSNQTGETLKVHVKMGDGKIWNWTFAPDQVAYLAINDERITASEVLIWGETESKNFNANQTEPLVLVAADYQSASIGTYTLTFNP